MNRDAAKEIENMIRHNMDIQPYIDNAREEAKQLSLFDDCCIYASKLLNSMAVMFLLAISATVGIGFGILILSAIFLS